MISDVLHDAVSDLDHYLESETYRTVYTGDTRDKIIVVRNAMDALRRELDTLLSVN